MGIRRIASRLLDARFEQPGPVLRYLLPLLTMAAALTVQLVVAQLVPKKADFPYVLLYLIAIFVTAWFGSYVPGAIACLITLVGLPMLATPGHRLTSIDPSRL